jgi:hypothetical protein
MSIEKLDLLKLRTIKCQAGRRQRVINYYLSYWNLPKDIRQAFMQTLIVLAKLRVRCDELERVNESLQQSLTNGKAQ